MAKSASQTRTVSFGPPQAGPVPESASHPTGRRGRRALAIALIVGPVVLGGILLSGSSSTGPAVLAAAHALSPGQRLGADDLTTVHVRVTGPGVATIPASQRDAIVGQRVTGPLAAGTILSPAAVAPNSGLAPGQVGMALALEPDQAAQGILASGDTVMLVGQVAPAGGAATPVQVNGRVLAVLPGPTDSGKVIVDLALGSPADANALAEAEGSTQGVRVVVLTGGGNG